MASFSASGKQALDDFIKEIVKSGDVPGFVLGVSNVDGEIYYQGGGPNIVGDPSSGEVGPDSVFWICSQTKMIVALAALKLVEDGKITFDTPLKDYLTELANPVIVDKTSTPDTTFRPAETVLTVRHLLNFSSGLFYPVVADDLAGLPEAYTSKDMFAASDPEKAFYQILTGKLPGIPLKFEPGTDFVYGFSSDILGFLIEKVSGQTLEKFCRERIFDPLGMESPSFYSTPDLMKRLVSLSVRDSDGKLKPWEGEIKIMEQDPQKVRLHLGGVGLYSSTRDYLKLLHHILQINAGKDVANPIFRTETVHQLFVPVLTEKGSKSLSDFVTIPGMQWGTAAAITTADFPQGRKKGSLWWGGWATTMHFIDPTSGIALVFGTQVVPTNGHSAQSLAVFQKLEALVYAALASPTSNL